MTLLGTEVTAMAFFRDRVWTLILIAVLVPVGFGTKLYAGFGEEWVRHHLGGLLFVVFWCLVASLVWRCTAHWRIGVSVLVATCLIEVSQLWHPEFLVVPRQNLIGGAILGDDFDWGDFPHYVFGAVVGVFLLNVLNHRSGEFDGVP